MNGMVFSTNKESETTLFFPKEFFRGEFRSDFFVPKMLKHAWAAELEVLAEIDRICKKHDITWFADSGTLLGAARHKGFIPWDDDIDIAMLRKDYNRFLEVCEKEIEERFILVKPYTIQQFEQSFFRVAENFEYKHYGNNYAKFHYYPYLAGVDIFPLDYIAPEKKEAESQLEAAAYIDTARQLYRMGKKKEMVENLREIEKMTKIPLDWSGDIDKQLGEIFNKVCQLYTEEKSEELVIFPVPYTMPDWRFKKEWYRDTVLLDFEYFKIPCPIDYDKILTACYGDWRKFEKGTATHDFPYYKGQRESLYKDIKENVLQGLGNMLSRLLNIPKEKIEIYDILKQGNYNITVCLKIETSKYALRIQNPMGKNIFRVPNQTIQTLADYKREHQIYETLKGMEITDDYLFHSINDGSKMSYFIEDAKPLDPKNREEVSEAVEVISYVHGLEVSGTLSFDLWEYIERYETFWGDSSYFEDYRESKDKINECYQYILTQPGRFGITHFNLSGDNFLIQQQKDGRNDIRIIGWEYAGIQDTHLDLAMFALRACYSKEEFDWLIDLYFREQCPENIRLKLYCYMSVLSLMLSNFYEYMDRMGDDMTEERISYHKKALEYYDLFKSMKK